MTRYQEIVCRECGGNQITKSGKTEQGIQRYRCQSEAFCEAEMDEQRSFVGKKSEQRWLWYAIDHVAGIILAYVLGKRKDEVFKQLKAFNIARYYTDDWGAYERHLDSATHQIGKQNPRKIERKKLESRNLDQAFDPENYLFFQINIDVRHRHWTAYQYGRVWRRYSCEVTSLTRSRARNPIQITVALATP
ncbi:MAG: IS1 family transposase [Methylobacter sp.]|jgi:insertion element IS1 protein InsB|nr:IS1 family transposase [Methylobacter sp.]